MKRFKGAIFPVLVFIVIIIALLYRLSSCATTADKNVASGESAPASFSAAVTSDTPSPTPSAATSSPSHAARYTDDDIRLVFEKDGYTVKEIRTVLDATIVQYCKLNQGTVIYSKFAWFDRETGSLDVVCDGLPADTFEITPPKTLTVLTTGISYVNGKQLFPEVFTSFYNGWSDTQEYFSKTEPYYMPLEKSFTVSDDRLESIRSIVFDYDAVSVGFVPQPGHEIEFEIAYRYIPKTGVVCSSGYCYVTFYNTTLSDSFKAPKAGEGDGLRTFASVTCDGTNTILTLKLGEKADRYNISTGYSPDDGMPYAVLRFRSDGDISPAYPAGW